MIYRFFEHSSATVFYYTYTLSYVKVILSKFSNLETSASQRWPIACSNSGVECKSHCSNAIWLVTIERGRSHDTISFVKLKLKDYYKTELRLSCEFDILFQDSCFKDLFQKFCIL